MSELCQLIAFVLVAAVAALLLAAGWSGMATRRRMSEIGVPVVGTLTAGDDDEDGGSYVTIRYKVADIDFDLTAYYISGKLGDPVNLLVDPTEPRKAVVARASAGAMSLASFLCGGILLVVSLLCAFEAWSRYAG